MRQRDLIIGVGLALAGVVILIGPLLDLEKYGWPLLVIAPGAILLFISLTSRVADGALAIPGAVVTTTGVILLVLQLIGRMHAWAYSWALVMAAAGVGTYLYGMISETPALKKAGQRGGILGAVLFVVFGLLFELLIFGTFSNALRWIAPILLLLAGAFFIYRYVRNQQASKPPAQPL